MLEEFENQAIANADHLLSPSRALANELRSLVPQSPQIEISPHPVDPAFLEPGPVAHAGDEILYVGRLEQRKGVEVLVDAAARLLTETSLRVKQIAVRTGFGDAGSLGTAFARRHGATPSAFRRLAGR